MSNSKEISKLYTDENVVRFVAAQVVLLSLVAAYTESVILLIILVVDFGIRAYTFFPSPLALIGKFLQKTLRLKPHPIFAPPKKFAALLGFLFSLSALFLIELDLVFYAQIVLGILILCAFLESVFKICLGCYFYNWIIVPLHQTKNKKSS